MKKKSPTPSLIDNEIAVKPNSLEGGAVHLDGASLNSAQSLVKRNATGKKGNQKKKFIEEDAQSKSLDEIALASKAMYAMNEGGGIASDVNQGPDLLLAMNESTPSSSTEQESDTCKSENASGDKEQDGCAALLPAGGVTEGGIAAGALTAGEGGISAGAIAAGVLLLAGGVAAGVSGGGGGGGSSGGGSTGGGGATAAPDTTAPAAPTVTLTPNPDGTLTVGGHAEPGSTVKVTMPDGTIVTTTADTDGRYSASSTTVQSSGEVRVTATDAANNISPAATDNYVDTTAPAAPTVTLTPNPDGTLTVGGHAEPGSTVKVTMPDGTIVTTTADTDGRYSASSTTVQSSGEVRVTATDAANNISPAATDNYVDTTAPAAPTGDNTVALALDTGISSSDRITNDQNVKVSLTLGSSLTLATGEFLQVSADGGATWVNTTGAGTAWATADDAVTLQAGSSQHITARITDAAGNVSPVTLKNNDYVYDAGTTAAPTGDNTVALALDTGISSSDRITNDQNVKVSLTLGSSLTLATGEFLQVSADGGATWVNTTGAGTAWATADDAVTLQAGSSQHITARITDAAGNVSPVTLKNNDYVYDAGTTAAPTGDNTVALALDTGISSSDRITNDQNVKVSLTLGSSLTLATGEFLQVSADGGATWVNTTGAGTAWATADDAVTLQAGSSQHITARITDAAGNVSPVTLKNNDYVYDAGTTAAPTGDNTVALALDTGISSSDRITNDQNVKVSLTLGSSLTLATGEFLQVSADGGATWVNTTGAGTAWATADDAVTLQAGSSQHITARITDAAGNVSPVTLKNNDYVYDAGTTAAPTGDNTVALALDTGISSSDRITNDQNVKVSLTLGSSLTLATGEFLQVSADGGATWVNTTGAGTAWATADDAVTLQAGSSQHITARITDAAGNVSPVTLKNNDYVYDAGTTAAPTGDNTVALALDTGISSSDRITNDQNVKVSLTLGSSLTLATGEFLQVSADGGATWVNTTGAGTAWATADDAVTLQAGSSQHITARITDAAGNVSPVTLKNNDYVYDAGTTAAPTGDNTVALALDTGISSSDRITNDQNVKVSLTLGSSLTLATGEFLQVSADGGATWVNTTGAGTAWATADDAVTLQAGSSQHITARITDAAGNVSPVTLKNNDYVYDTLAPTATITDDTAGTASGPVTFTFTFDEAVSGFDDTDVTVSAGTVGTFTAVSPTVYTLVVTPPSSDGTMEVGVTAGSFSDLAGNLNTVAPTPDSQPYASSEIDLGAGNGKLILPVDVDGSRFYLWSRNGDSAFNAGDIVTHDYLNTIFNHNINGTVNPAGITTDTTYRYGYINGVHLALPVAGAPGGSALVNTAVNSSPPNQNNPTYDGLAAIWDAYSNATNSAGMPPGWSASGVGSVFWAADGTANSHSSVSLHTGYVNVYRDDNYQFSILQVVL